MSERSFTFAASVIGYTVSAMCLLTAPVRAQRLTRGTDSTAACPDARYVNATQLDTAAPRAAANARKPDVIVLAFFRAEEVRFSAQPRIAVRVCGDLDSAHIIARRNLPDPVVVGETYRDVYIAVELIGRVKTADSISAHRPPR
jgi:hypothetical protein